ncbi:hypothetical protein HDV03_003124 [Kappamyces sp. JEL0829]|nr:hypothetical protein HDV03_003109 [Kappamyces sp. JEL0829]KAJ3304138.1 hypothetical protein HDV03_003124 [Kappamyces sp. JEL0829]
MAPGNEPAMYPLLDGSIPAPYLVNSPFRVILAVSQGVTVAGCTVILCLILVKKGGYFGWQHSNRIMAWVLATSILAQVSEIHYVYVNSPPIYLWFAHILDMISWYTAVIGDMAFFSYFTVLSTFWTPQKVLGLQIGWTVFSVLQLIPHFIGLASVGTPSPYPYIDKWETIGTGLYFLVCTLYHLVQFSFLISLISSFLFRRQGSPQIQTTLYALVLYVTFFLLVEWTAVGLYTYAQLQEPRLIVLQWTDDNDGITVLASLISTTSPVFSLGFCYSTIRNITIESMQRAIPRDGQDTIASDLERDRTTSCERIGKTELAPTRILEIGAGGNYIETMSDVNSTAEAARFVSLELNMTSGLPRLLSGLEGTLRTAEMPERGVLDSC